MKCNTCHSFYTEFNEVPGQAADCSASLYLKDGHYYILAHYGSRYDMQRFALAEGDKYDIGNICDDCIEKYLDSNKAHLIEDGVW